MHRVYLYTYSHITKCNMDSGLRNHRKGKWTTNKNTNNPKRMKVKNFSSKLSTLCKINLCKTF